MLAAQLACTHSVHPPPSVQPLTTPQTPPSTHLGCGCDPPLSGSQQAGALGGWAPAPWGGAEGVGCAPASPPALLAAQPAAEASHAAAPAAAAAGRGAAEAAPAATAAAAAAAAQAVAVMPAARPPRDTSPLLPPAAAWPHGWPAPAAGLPLPSAAAQVSAAAASLAGCRSLEGTAGCQGA